MNLTGPILKLIVPTLESNRAAFLADKMNFICPGYGMNSADIMHEFIANVAHESCGFAVKEENLNYSAERLLQVFGPKWFNTISAQRFAHQPEKIANYVYQRKELGNIYPGDGWKFRGGGFIQLTGRTIYEQYQQWTAFEDLDKLVNCVRTDDYYALDSACWFFAIQKRLIQAAIDDQFLKIVKAINGGYNGLADRQAYYERAKKYLS